jgi:hypothetical protein
VLLISFLPQIPGFDKFVLDTYEYVFVDKTNPYSFGYRIAEIGMNYPLLFIPRDRPFLTFGPIGAHSFIIGVMYAVAFAHRYQMVNDNMWSLSMLPDGNGTLRTLKPAEYKVHQTSGPFRDLTNGIYMCMLEDEVRTLEIQKSCDLITTRQ